MTLKKWFNKQFRNKILGTTAVLLIAQIAIVILFAVNQLKQFKRDVSAVSDIVSLGISQKNHELVVSTLGSATERWSASSLELCYGEKQLFSIPTYNLDCLNRNFGKGLFEEEEVVQGFGDVRLRVVRLPFRANELVLILIASSLLIYVIAAKQLRSILNSVQVDLFTPLANRLVENKSFDIAELEELRGSIIEWKENSNKFAESEAMSLLAAQVAHDIRSPLSAINAALGNPSEITAGHITLITKAAARINDIANGLLKLNKLNPNQSAAHPPGTSAEASRENSEINDISAIVREIYDEKKIQLALDNNVDLRLDVSSATIARCGVNRPEILRVISNLTNNAIESLDGNGNVTMAVRRSGDSVSVVILDTGKGIPEEIIARLGSERVSYGKLGTNSGAGLGVFHAKTAVERMRGRLHIQSRVGLGTMVTMSFPSA